MCQIILLFFDEQLDKFLDNDDLYNIVYCDNQMKRAKPCQQLPPSQQLPAVHSLIIQLV